MNIFNIFIPKKNKNPTVEELRQRHRINLFYACGMPHIVYRNGQWFCMQTTRHFRHAEFVSDVPARIHGKGRTPSLALENYMKRFLP